MGELMKTHWHLTYPKTKINSENDRSKKPLVIIFGWMGAQDKHVKIYSQIYEDQGFPTLRLTVSPLLLFFNHSQHNKYSEKMVELLDEPDFAERPVLIHLFSNGGSLQYCNFLKALGEAKGKMIKGVIFDSGPAKWSLYNTLTVSSMLLGALVKNKVLLYPLTIAVWSMVFSLIVLKKIQTDILRLAEPMMDPYMHLMNQKNDSSQMFIYSKMDRLVPYKDMEYFISSRKAKGVDVTYKIYDKTAHVRHYPSDKLGYSKTVLKFVNKVLKK